MILRAISHFFSEIFIQRFQESQVGNENFRMQFRLCFFGSEWSNDIFHFLKTFLKKIFKTQFFVFIKTNPQNHGFHNEKLKEQIFFNVVTSLSPIKLASHSKELWKTHPWHTMIY